MAEIYVKEMPETVGQAFTDELKLEVRMWFETGNDISKAEIKLMHDHDKELVGKVLEKVKKKLNNISMHTNTKERLMIMCEEIQKDFENAEI